MRVSNDRSTFGTPYVLSQKYSAFFHKILDSPDLLFKLFEVHNETVSWLNYFLIGSGGLLQAGSRFVEE